VDTALNENRVTRQLRESSGYKGREKTTSELNSLPQGTELPVFRIISKSLLCCFAVPEKHYLHTQAVSTGGIGVFSTPYNAETDISRFIRIQYCISCLVFFL
jgi:hypothetical protein